MEINDEKRVDVLISALEERYASMHKIRDRVQSIGIWTLGLLVSASVWLIQSQAVFNCFQKTFFVLGVLFASLVLHFVYLEDLRKGFRGQQRAAVQIEKSLGLFNPGFFNKSHESIYPLSWEKTGTKEGDGKFFASTYILLYTGVAFLLISILLSGSFSNYKKFQPHQYYFHIQQRK